MGFVDSVLDYFKLPEHQKNPPPGTGAAQPGRTPREVQRRAPAPAPTAQQSAPPASPPADETVPPRISERIVPPQNPATSIDVSDEPVEILLVEDDPKWAKLVQAYITAINGERSLGKLKLDVAETLSSTRKKLEKKDYDLIFLDLMLPDSNGIHTFDSVWERVAEVQTPVIVMSNLDSGGVMDRVREVTGRDILLKKNISKKVLFGTIDNNIFDE